MKINVFSNRFYGYLILALLTILVYGCNNSDDEVIVSSSMQAKVNGYLRVCRSVNLSPNPNPFNEPHNGISGATKEAANYWFSLKFPISNGVGTYHIGDDNNEGSISIIYKDIFDSNNRTFWAISGTIIVSEVTKNSYKGTFFFTAKEFDDIVNVEEGVFEVIY